VEALDRASAILSANFLRDFHLTKVEEGFRTSPSYIIRITASESLPGVPSGLDSFEVAYGHCYVNGESYFLDVEDSLIAVHNQGARAMDVWIGSTAHARRPLSLVNVMSYVLEASLRRCGLFQLHGSGVTAPNEDRGVLIIGASGSGKSTLATLLAARGWSYLTDDALLLNLEQERVRARGIRKFFAASQKTLSACAVPDIENALGPPITSDPSKRRLAPEIAFPGMARESCIPEMLVFSSITSNPKSVVRPLSAAQAMAQLIKLNPWASYDATTAREHLGLLSTLANQCRSFSLAAGLDILAQASYAAELLTSLLAA
jgi:hypothetical protein